MDGLVAVKSGAEALEQPDVELRGDGVAAMEVSSSASETRGSLLHQYLEHVAHGNLGISALNYPASVATVLNNTAPWTIVLVGSATIVSFVIRDAARVGHRSAAPSSTARSRRATRCRRVRARRPREGQIPHTAVPAVGTLA